MLLGSIMVCLSHKISDTLEAAACLKVAVTTLRNWRALKQGPQFLKIGARLVRYRRSDLAAFISHDSRKDAA